MFKPSILILLILCHVSAFSATKTWSGLGADANWLNPANWVGGVAPVANDDLVFPSGAAQPMNSNNFPSSTTFTTITVDGGTYFMGGNTVRLTNGLVVNSGTHTFTFAINPGAAQTFFAGPGSSTTLLALSMSGFTITLDGPGSFGIGIISGLGGIIKNGSGASLLNQAVFYSSPITVNDGIFVVDANIPGSAVTVNNSLTGTFNLSGFGGTGTVGPVSVTQGVISAGTLTSPTGILNTGNLTFTANGNYVCKIGGPTPGANGHDQLNVTGAVTLNNARLAPLPWGGFRPAVGDTFVILRNDGTDAVNGTFLNAPEGAVFAGPLNTAFRITYHGGDGNDIAVTRVARAPFDFDGDGKSDVSVFRPSNGTWNVVLSQSSSTISQSWGLATDNPVPADYDGDNRTDLAVFRPSEGVWYILNSFTSTVSIIRFGANGDKPVPNDFDGDGRADLAVYRPATGVWWELRSLGNQNFAQQFGLPTDLPQMVDFDGDGIGDLCLFRPVDGTWHFWLSSTNSYAAFPFGSNGDVPTPADYDGDGRTDVSVFRAATDPALPDLYILLSGPQTYYGVSWGVPGDVPVVADYDGDGRSDVGVVRPTTNDWYLLRSMAGFTAVNFGQPGDTALPSVYGH